jgi:hypothetical protein
MRLQIWNIRKFYKTGSLKSIERIFFAKYNFDSVRFQKLRRDEVGNEKTDDYTLL